MVHALDASPVPTYEWPRLVNLLGVELLARLVGISPSSVRRYHAGSRPTPDEVAARLHFLALVVGDLAGAHNDGTTEADGSWAAWLKFIRHPRVTPHLSPYHLGNSEEEARHWLLLDRESRSLCVGGAEEVGVSVLFLQNHTLRRKRTEGKRASQRFYTSSAMTFLAADSAWLLSVALS